MDPCSTINPTVEEAGSEGVETLRTELEEARQIIATIKLEAQAQKQLARDKLERAKSLHQGEVAALTMELNMAKQRLTDVWRMNCEYVTEQDRVLTERDEELVKSKSTAPDSDKQKSQRTLRRRG